MNNIRKVILMGIFATLFGCGKNDGRFISQTDYEKTLSLQTTMSPQTLTQLRDYGVTDDTQLKLEYFFYTDTEAKAQALTKELLTNGYSAEFGLAAGDKKQQLITGWTTPIQMNEDEVISWTKQMCELGFKYDCDFDGWGTNPTQ